MAWILHGDRISSQGTISVGCSATLFDHSKQKVLLTRRNDNGQWCLPGGHAEPGESVGETCIREVAEETGLHVRVVHLIGVYSNPNRLQVYTGGDRYHIVALNFEVEVVGGILGISDETVDYGYFAQDEIEGMDIFETHRERIVDAFAFQERAFVR